tara:strand:- start:6315 stop:6914 length:600 start_codon:yes stop_codon:yes gene_type:complete
MAFYRPEGKDEPWINTMTSWLTGKFVHVELLFVDPATGKQNLASGVWQNETVFFRRKTFGRTSWSFKSVKVTKKQAVAMREFCSNAAKANIPFNKSGLLRCCTPFPRPTDHAAYFCSELAVCAFQSAGLYKGTIPSMVTPTALWDMVDDANQHATASPLIDERINKSGLRFHVQRTNQPRSDPTKRTLTKKWSQFTHKK